MVGVGRGLHLELGAPAEFSGGVIVTGNDTRIVEPGIGQYSGSPIRTATCARQSGWPSLPRFIVPITQIDQRAAEVMEPIEPGHWEGDCSVGAYKQSAIGTLVEGTFRYTILRPSTENANGLLRNSLPRSTNVRVSTRDYLDRVSDELNRRPRKRLGWKAPDDLWGALGNSLARRGARPGVPPIFQSVVARGAYLDAGNR